MVRARRPLRRATLAALLIAATAGAPRAETGPIPVVHLHFVQVRKVNQLLGEIDKQYHKPTLSRTVTRYGLEGTDLGQSFEYRGRAYFLFGDTLGVEGGALDSIGTTDVRDPANGVKLDFLSQRPQTYVTIRPPGIEMGAFDTPVAGIVVSGNLYVVVDSGRTANPKGDVGYSELTRVSWPITPSSFKPLGPISTLPNGHFLKMALHHPAGRALALPAGGPYVFVWGSGWYRHSDVYFALRPVGAFEKGTGTWYYAGPGKPWTHDEQQAAPVVKNGTVGDVSVTWCNDLQLWLMTYDSRPPAPDGIVFQWSTTPWGPWSAPQIIFNAVRDGAMGTFIHDASLLPRNDGLAGPTIGKVQKHPLTVSGGAYAPYVVERWTRRSGNHLTIYFTLSTWNPYVVELMSATFDITRTYVWPRPSWPPHPIPYPTRPI